MSTVQHDLKTLTAKDLMTSAMLTLSEQMTLQDASAFLTEHEISGAPVVDEEGKFVGVLSVTDIARDCAERGEIATERFFRHFYSEGWEDEVDPSDMEHLMLGNESRTVADTMNPSIFTVPEDTPVVELAETMITGRVHRLFVTQNERLVGIVTTLDLLKLLTSGNESPGR